MQRRAENILAFLMRTLRICLQIICCVTNHPKLSGLKQTPFGGFATWAVLGWVVLLVSLMWLHPICRSTGTGWSWVSSLTYQIGSSPIPLVLCRNNRLRWELASFGSRALNQTERMEMQAQLSIYWPEPWTPSPVSACPVPGSVPTARHRV